MPGSVSSSLVCLGVSAIGTPQRRDNLTFGPMYRPMNPTLSTGGPVTYGGAIARLRTCDAKFPSTYSRSPGRMVLRHATRPRRAARNAVHSFDGGTGLYASPRPLQAAGPSFPPDGAPPPPQVSPTVAKSHTQNVACDSLHLH